MTHNSPVLFLENGQHCCYDLSGNTCSGCCDYLVTVKTWEVLVQENGSPGEENVDSFLTANLNPGRIKYYIVKGF